MRRTPLALGLVLGLAALVVPAPVQATGSDHVPVSHGGHSWRTVDAMVPVRTGPDRDIAIDLDTRLYVPDNASRKHPQPVVMMTHGFGLSKTAAEVVSTARFFAAHGYVVLTWTSSGFGAS